MRLDAEQEWRGLESMWLYVGLAHQNRHLTDEVLEL